MLSLNSFRRSSPLTPWAPATAASAILRSLRSSMSAPKVRPSRLRPALRSIRRSRRPLRPACGDPRARRRDIVGAFGRFGADSPSICSASATASSAGASSAAASAASSAAALRPEASSAGRRSSAGASSAAASSATGGVCSADSPRDLLGLRRVAPRWQLRRPRQRRPRPLPAALRRLRQPRLPWLRVPRRAPSPSRPAQLFSGCCAPCAHGGRRVEETQDAVRRLRADGSQCEMRSASSFTRSGESFASSGLYVPSFSMKRPSRGRTAVGDYDAVIGPLLGAAASEANC